MKMMIVSSSHDRLKEGVQGKEETEMESTRSTSVSTRSTSVSTRSRHVRSSISFISVKNVSC